MLVKHEETIISAGKKSPKLFGNKMQCYMATKHKHWMQMWEDVEIAVLAGCVMLIGMYKATRIGWEEKNWYKWNQMLHARLHWYRYVICLEDNSWVKN